jgi:hypothetical protein
LGQAHRLLEGSHRADQRVEQVEQDQGAVLIEVKLAVVSAVAVAADLVKSVLPHFA